MSAKSVVFNTESQLANKQCLISNAQFQPGETVMVCDRGHAYSVAAWKMIGEICVLCHPNVAPVIKKEQVQPASTGFVPEWFLKGWFWAACISAFLLGGLGVLVALSVAGIFSFQGLAMIATQQPTPTQTTTPSLTPTVPLATRTKTLTPTRRPSTTPTSTSPASATLVPTSTNTAVPNTQACTNNVTGRYSNLWKQYRTELGCPLSPTEKGIQDAEQLFQNGHLFWRADADRYYAIFDGGGASFGGWAVYSRKNGAIQGCPEAPPAGYQKPISGFGDVWCFMGGINSQMGWALDREYGFQSSQGIHVQDFERGLIFRDSDGARRNLVYVLTKLGFYRVSP